MDADPELQQYTELSRVDQVVSDSCYPAPALADGILVIKDRSGTMAAYDLRAR